MKQFDIKLFFKKWITRSNSKYFKMHFDVNLIIYLWSYVLYVCTGTEIKIPNNFGNKMIRIEVLKLHTPSKKIQLKIVLDRTVNLMKSELFQTLHKSPNFKPFSQKWAKQTNPEEHKILTLLRTPGSSTKIETSKSPKKPQISNPQIWVSPNTLWKREFYFYNCNFQNSM